MQKKVHKNKNQDCAKAMVSATLPWGILTSSTLNATDPIELSKTRRNLQWLHDMGLYQKTLISKGYRDLCGKSRPVNRSFLTEDGIEWIFTDILPDEPIIAVPENYTMALKVKQRKSIQRIDRMIRMSDTQLFLSCLGVDNSFAAIQHGVNPFVFGFTKKGDNVFSDLAAYLEEWMSQYVRRKNLPLAGKDTVEKCPCLFLSNYENPYAEIVTQKTTEKENEPDEKTIRGFNNSLGILFDFVHMEAYVIFKSSDRSKLVWRSKGYASFLDRCSKKVRDMGFTNIDTFGNIQDAIIFYETPGELRSKATVYPALASSPFRRIHPLMIRQCESNILDTILTEGLNGYYEIIAEEILEAYPDVQIINSSNKLLRMKYNGLVLYDGLTMNLASFQLLSQKIANNEKFYLACYTKQIDIYHDLLEIPMEYILEIT